jgi:hypothetical protein
MLGYGGVDRSYDLTWEQLVAAEPRLASLLEEVWMARPVDADEFELEGVWGHSKIGSPFWSAGIEGKGNRFSKRRRLIEPPTTRS